MRWDEEYDVVVVGSGISGLAGGLAAAKEGARTIVLEKADSLGGSTSWSYGLLWIGTNALAQEQGYKDNRANVKKYMAFLGGHQTDARRLDAYIDSSILALDYFRDAGVKFRVARGVHDHYFGVAPGATEEGRTVEVELISGSELGEWQDRILLPDTTPYRVNLEEAVKWGGVESVDHWDPQTMREREKSDLRGMGVGLVSHFVKCLVDREVPIRAGVGAESLVKDGDRVVGVVTDDGRRIEAKRGVLIAAGGYESNPELVETFEELPGFQSEFPESITGDGLLLGTEVGGTIRMIHNNLATMLGFIVEPEDGSGHAAFRVAGIIELCSPHTLVVNGEGRRFADESYFQTIVPALKEYDCMRHQYRNLPCYLIFDRQFADKYSFAGLPAGAEMPSWVSSAKSLPALAKKLGVDPEGMSATVETFNGFAEEGVDGDFGRGEQRWALAQAVKPTKNRSLGPLEKAPFYGIELKPCGLGSAGLSANEYGQVIHVRGKPIDGLYASGNVAAHNEYGVGYQAGYSLASGMTFSWLAVRHMLGQKN